MTVEGGERERESFYSAIYLAQIIRERRKAMKSLSDINQPIKLNKESREVEQVPFKFKVHIGNVPEIPV